MLALQNSAPGSVSGRLVPAGLGRSEDLAGLDLGGAIALLERGEITFGDKVRNVAEAGAVGAVIYNQAGGSFRGLLQDPSTIPAAGLDGPTGRRLAERASQSQLQAELVVDASIVETTSGNVVATLAGSSDEMVVLGAHYDSVADGPGANDNASGTATVLELARTLPAAELPATIRIVLFGAEEIGLVGSRYYVDSLSMQERERIVSMLNFDMVGVGEQPMVGGTDDLVQLAQEIAGEQGVQVGELGSDLDGRSDHAPFLEAGVPTLFFHRLDDPRYHTAGDRSEYVEAEGIDVAGRLALAAARGSSGGAVTRTKFNDSVRILAQGAATSQTKPYGSNSSGTLSSNSSLASRSRNRVPGTYMRSVLASTTWGSSEKFAATSRRRAPAWRTKHNTCGLPLSTTSSWLPSSAGCRLRSLISRTRPLKIRPVTFGASVDDQNAGDAPSGCRQLWPARRRSCNR